MGNQKVSAGCAGCFYPSSANLTKPNNRTNIMGHFQHQNARSQEDRYKRQCLLSMDPQQAQRFEQKECIGGGCEAGATAGAWATAAQSTFISTAQRDGIGKAHHQLKKQRLHRVMIQDHKNVPKVHGGFYKTLQNQQSDSSLLNLKSGPPPRPPSLLGEKRSGFVVVHLFYCLS